MCNAIKIIGGGLLCKTSQGQENITVALPLTGGRSTKNNRSSYDAPKPRPHSIVLRGRFPFWDVLVLRKVKNFFGHWQNVAKTTLHFKSLRPVEGSGVQEESLKIVHVAFWTKIEIKKFRIQHLRGGG